MLKAKDLDENIYTVQFGHIDHRTLQVCFVLVPEDTTLEIDHVYVDTVEENLTEILHDNYYTILEDE